MCGLVGIASVGALSKPEKDVFTDLLFVDTLRGQDSTGVFSVDMENKVDVYKSVLDGPSFIQHQNYERLFMSHTSRIRVLAGHNRKATLGKVSTKNAHPFFHGDVVLMHNGTLTTQTNLKKSYSFDTDSECVCYNISQVEPNQVGEVIEMLNGAFALVWWDVRDNTLNFIRNNERDLYIGQNKSPEPTTIAWASEKPMLDLTFGRSNTQSVTEIHYIKPMHHYKVHLDDKTVKVDKLRIYKEYQRPKYGNGGTDWWYNNNRYNSNNRTQPLPLKDDVIKGEDVDILGETKRITHQQQASHTGYTRYTCPPAHYPGIGQKVYFEPITWERYPENDELKAFGECTGCVVITNRKKDVTAIAHIHGVKKDMFDEWEATKAVINATVLNFRHEPKTGEHELILHFDSVASKEVAKGEEKKLLN